MATCSGPLPPGPAPPGLGLSVGGLGATMQAAVECAPGDLLDASAYLPGSKGINEMQPSLAEFRLTSCLLAADWGVLMLSFASFLGRMTRLLAQGAGGQVVQNGPSPAQVQAPALPAAHRLLRGWEPARGRQEREGRRSRPEKLNVHKCRPGTHKVGQSH